MHAVSTNQVADILHFNDKRKKSTQTVTKSKQVTIDKNQMNVRKWADKNTKYCTESVS